MSCSITLSNLLSSSSLLVPGPYCLIFLRYRGWEKRKLLCICCCSRKTLFLNVALVDQVNTFAVKIGFYSPFFIGFDSNTLSNSLLSPVLYVVTLILLSIDHVHPHNPSNTPSTEFPVLIFYASILLSLYILLLH